MCKFMWLCKSTDSSSVRLSCVAYIHNHFCTSHLRCENASWPLTFPSIHYWVKLKIGYSLGNSAPTHLLFKARFVTQLGQNSKCRVEGGGEGREREGVVGL